MRKLLSFLGIALFATFLIIACKKTEKASASTEITPDVLSQIKALGFATDNVTSTDGGYLVEGDIFLTSADLTSAKVTGKVLVANVEQYRTTNLVTGLPRTITVSVGSGFNSTFISAVDAALARYNAENLQLTFTRVSSGGMINIKLVNTNQYIASSGFPSGGNPYGTISYAKRYSTGYSLGFLTTVIAHEMGHCIGFRHTDYMDRSYSCGGSPYNEGASTVGAINIPGTPTAIDPNSWMLACLSATTDRPFNANDKTALSYLY